MTYAKKLKDPRWQKKRLEILNRDSFACMNCHDTEKTLHVHHTKYSIGDPWDVPNEYLVTLCESCHQEEEELKNSDIYQLISHTGLTRFHITILFSHISFVLNQGNKDTNPFWCFHENVIGKIIGNSDLNEYCKWLEQNKNAE